MKEKRLSREVAMQLLFQWELQGHLLRKTSTVPVFIKNIDLPSFLGHFLHNFYVKDKALLDIPFTAELVKGTILALDRIDSLIDEVSNKWRLNRMDAIDRAILRLACFELAIKGKLSAPMVINEAVELAKRYGSAQSAAFVNGILDTIKEKTSTK